MIDHCTISKKTAPPKVHVLPMAGHLVKSFLYIILDLLLRFSCVFLSHFYPHKTGSWGSPNRAVNRLIFFCFVFFFFTSDQKTSALSALLPILFHLWCKVLCKGVGYIFFSFFLTIFFLFTKWYLFSALNWKNMLGKRKKEKLLIPPHG